jgi:hypothetical protein
MKSPHNDYKSVSTTLTALHLPVGIWNTRVVVKRKLVRIVVSDIPAFGADNF